MLNLIMAFLRHINKLFIVIISFNYSLHKFSLSKLYIFLSANIFGYKSMHRSEQVPFFVCILWFCFTYNFLLQSFSNSVCEWII